MNLLSKFGKIVIMITILMHCFIGCQYHENIANEKHVGDLKIGESISKEGKHNKNLRERDCINTDDFVDNKHDTFDLFDKVDEIQTRERLMQVLEKKDWGDKVESLMFELYDCVVKCYDIRELYKPDNKQIYLENLVDTIESVNVIKIDPNDEILIANGWTARADYVNNQIVNRYANTVNFRHELAHMENGTFLNGSNYCDLGFVLEEGRCSYKEGDAMPRLDWVDAYSVDVDPDPINNLVICDCSGSYPAFEEIYKCFIKLGIDLEDIRIKALPLQIYEKQIEDELNVVYGNRLGSEYIEAVNSYIAFFDNHGKVKADYFSGQLSVYESKQLMESIYEECMVQNNK